MVTKRKWIWWVFQVLCTGLSVSIAIILGLQHNWSGIFWAVVAIMLTQLIFFMIRLTETYMGDYTEKQSTQIKKPANNSITFNKG